MSTLFPSHSRSGVYGSKGPALAPHVQMPMESVAKNRGGIQSGTNDEGWTSHLIVDTGLTHGDDSNMK